MPKAKKNSANIKEWDGRKNNGRKVGTKVTPKLTPAKLNKAKKDRMVLYATNAIINEYGSEEEFWNMIAQHAKKSYNHAKMIVEYAYGKPKEDIAGGGDKKAPVINFYNNTPAPQIDNTIDIPHDED